jgi:hypothetical protein
MSRRDIGACECHQYVKDLFSLHVNDGSNQLHHLIACFSRQNADDTPIKQADLPTFQDKKISRMGVRVEEPVFKNLFDNQPDPDFCQLFLLFNTFRL